MRTDSSGVMSSSAMNPHIHAFMEKKKPKTGTGIRTVVKRAEEDTTLNYPKDLQGTVLMCELPAHLHLFRALARDISSTHPS